MGVFSPASASGVSAADVLISSASNAILLFTIVDTEESFTIPSGTKAVMFKARGNAKLQYSFTVATSGTTYITMYPGYQEEWQSLNIEGAGLTIYIQSSVAGETLEIVYFS